MAFVCDIINEEEWVSLYSMNRQFHSIEPVLLYIDFTSPERTMGPDGLYSNIYFYPPYCDQCP